MENAALNAIKEYLETGESVVGTHVDVRHLIATPVGREVIGHAEVTRTDGRKIFFRVWATDGEEEIGAGTLRAHDRQHLAHCRENDGEVRTDVRWKLILMSGSPRRLPVEWSIAGAGRQLSAAPLTRE